MVRAGSFLALGLWTASWAVGFVACGAFPVDGNNFDDGGPRTGVDASRTPRVDDAGRNIEEDDASAAVPPGCVEADGPRVSAPCLTDGYGVFVEEGALDGDGTRAKPYGSLAAAIGALDVDVASRKLIFVSEGTYRENVSLTFGYSIYGGFTKGFASAAGAESLVAPDAGIALQIRSANRPMTIEKMAFQGASGSSLEARNSIAVLLSQTGTAEKKALFRDVRIAAADAFVPTPQAAGGTGYGVRAEDGEDNPCRENFVIIRRCRAGNGSACGGGAGGISGQAAPGGGGPGAGGCAAAAQPGVPGTASGTPAAGGPALAHGVLDASGWTPNGGGTGGAGAAGTGGGGGGGGKTTACDFQNNCTLINTYGGAGGAGGCGGGGGSGGHGGGASIAVVMFDAYARFERSQISAQQGGNSGEGGGGGGGQQGGEGGRADGSNGTGSCPSGAGGNGGAGLNGAAGGPGAPGISVGILWASVQPELDVDTEPRNGIAGPQVSGAVEPLAWPVASYADGVVTRQ